MSKVSYEKITKYCSWTILITFIGVCAFYIVHNAQWLVGDDAIVIRHTGMGNPFLPSDTTIPENGRFFPFSYLMYNVLLWFFEGNISPTIHYCYHAICFIVASVASFVFFLYIQRESKGSWKYIIALLATLFIASRVYSGFVNCFSTTWFGFFTQTFTILFFVLFIEKKSWVFGTLSFLLIVFSTYCSEVAFVLPFALGVCGLLFRWRQGWIGERVFYGLCVLNGVVFLLIYYFVVFVHVEEVYDSSHGEPVSVLSNAIRILWAQKFLWVAICLFLYRLWQVVCRKDSVTFYDILLLSAAAHCCGGFILKLNWILYYNRAIMFALPAVVFYGNKYLKERGTMILFLVYAMFYLIKLPGIISENQANRNNTKEFSDVITSLVKNGEIVYWLEPSQEQNESMYDFVNIQWLKTSLQALIRYESGNPNYCLQTINDRLPNIHYILTCPQTEGLLEQKNEEELLVKECIAIQQERGLKLTKIK